MVHRRGTFRASHALATQVLRHPKITVLWHASVARFVGDPGAAGLTAVELTYAADAAKGSKQADRPFKVACQAAFVAVGHDPVSSFLGGSGVAIGDGGYGASVSRPPPLVLPPPAGRVCVCVLRARRLHACFVFGFGVAFCRYVATVGDGSTRTSVPGLFAAGDVTDRVYRQVCAPLCIGARALVSQAWRAWPWFNFKGVTCALRTFSRVCVCVGARPPQAVTSAGSGAMAALDAERYLSGHA